MTWLFVHTFRLWSVLYLTYLSKYSFPFLFKWDNFCGVRFHKWDIRQIKSPPNLIKISLTPFSIFHIYFVYKNASNLPIRQIKLIILQIKTHPEINPLELFIFHCFSMRHLHRVFTHIHNRDQLLPFN